MPITTTFAMTSMNFSLSIQRRQTIDEQPRLTGVDTRLAIMPRPESSSDE